MTVSLFEPKQHKGTSYYCQIRSQAGLRVHTYVRMCLRLDCTHCLIASSHPLCHFCDWQDVLVSACLSEVVLITCTHSNTMVHTYMYTLLCRL